MQLVAIPLSTMMGWVSSPPMFCAASETVAELANTSLYKRTVMPHHLEDAESIHDRWEPSQQTHRCEESSSLVVHDPLAMTHCQEELSSLVVHNPLATTHCWEESSSLAVRGPLAMTPLASNPLALAQP